MALLLRFEEPHEGLQDSYRDLVREFREANEVLIPFPLGFPNDDFPSFVRRLAACARGEGPPSESGSRFSVPHSTWWLVSDGVVVGVTNLRHTLTDALRHDGGHIGYGVRPTARRRGFAGELLRGTLARARDLGLSKVLLTCDKANIASARTICRGGGVFSSEEFLPTRGAVIQRYWIDLRSA